MQRNTSINRSFFGMRTSGVAMRKLFALALVTLCGIGFAACNSESIDTSEPLPQSNVAFVQMPSSIRNGSDMEMSFEMSSEETIPEVAVWVYLAPLTVPTEDLSTLEDVNEAQLRESLRAPSMEVLNQYAFPAYVEYFDSVPPGDNNLNFDFSAPKELENGSYVPIVIIDVTPEDGLDDILGASSMNGDGEMVNQRIYVVPNKMQVVQPTLPDLTIKTFTIETPFVDRIPESVGRAVDPNDDCGRPIPTYESPEADPGLSETDQRSGDIDVTLSVAAFGSPVVGGMPVRFTAQINGIGTEYALSVLAPNEGDTLRYSIVPHYTFRANPESGNSFAIPDLDGVSDEVTEIFSSIDNAQNDRTATVSLIFSSELQTVINSLTVDTPIVIKAEVNPYDNVQEDDQASNVATGTVVFLNDDPNEGSLEEEESWSTLLSFGYSSSTGDKKYIAAYPDFGNKTNYATTGCKFKTSTYIDFDIALFNDKDEILDSEVTLRL
ncbi:MAG: hypothetical protein KDB07_04345, partial [Planctomycetes bacterium]|nr:hypothetical protein [Planctomycetota bacterium]